jgi:hypothetical protein
MVLPWDALVQSMVSLPALPVTVVAVWVTPGPTTQPTLAEAMGVLSIPRARVRRPMETPLPMRRRGR